jgi:hypothetical protein
MDTLLSGATAASSCLGPNLGKFATMMVKPVRPLLACIAWCYIFAPDPPSHRLIHLSLFLSLTYIQMTGVFISASVWSVLFGVVQILPISKRRTFGYKVSGG